MPHFSEKNSFRPDKHRVSRNKEDSLDYTWRMGYKKRYWKQLSGDVGQKKSFMRNALTAKRYL
jgi:hypothetical protein